MSKALNYGSYLRVDELLQLQTPRSSGPEHDELLFIVIHQVYELWFKELLHEIEYLQRLLCDNDAGRAAHTTRRILAILKTVVAQLDVLETLTPLEFNSFRGFLESASGFQSTQFRELEFILGYKRENVMGHMDDVEDALRRLRRRFEQPTLWDAFLRYLAMNGYAIPTEQLERDVRCPVQASPEVQAQLVEAYRHNATVSNVCEHLIDIDEGLQEWRYRHMKMVQRTIGIKPGTGGSPGAAYLGSTLKPFFPDLWAIRAHL
ncbi:tryptophan 2,3-dioxygenase [Dictyobacter sp. S3.2.2.5]|uniref:Tryptophan 2,3-dioxygenase n=1 Tax=Dictyobacter halimunensis TaxID=3026934 RepID=A0ABQ6FP42_9CHLR|nr:tryptophan 2,3-dioxygenase [Dictyobacter sp. S3.2.2.5]